MSQETPKFEMPHRSPDRAEGVEASVPDEPRAATQPAGDRETRARAGFGWRHLLIVGIVCALIGAAIPLAIQSAQQSAQTTRADALRGAAESYLSAIALGEWEQATSLVPTAGNAAVAPVEVLDAAERIQNPEVVLSQADGDAGIVQVRYEVPARPTALTVTRLLEAQYTGGSWQITTSLAELPSVANYEGVSVPAVAGVALSRPNALLLYPGSYTLDPPQSPIYQREDDTFVIDGDPGTVADVTAFPEWSEALLGEAESRAVQHAEACRAAGACDWPQTATIASAGESAVMGSASPVEIPVLTQIFVSSGAFNEGRSISVWLSLDGNGVVNGAVCEGLEGFSDEPIDCSA